MTNEQKNQVAAMNASGMSVDEIVIDTGLDKAEVETFVTEHNKKKGKPTLDGFKPVEVNSKRTVITPELRQAVVEYWQQGNSEGKTGRKFGISQSTVHRIVTSAKEKEPAAAATATDSEHDRSVVHKDITISPESQALRGVEVIGLMQTMLISVEENFGDNVDIISLRADSEQAHLMFRYGGTDYVLSFELAF